MKLEDLFKNAYYKAVISDSQKLLAKEDRKDRVSENIKRSLDGKPIKSRWDKLPAGERFHISTFRATSEIISKLQALEHSAAYINSYPNSSLWRKSFTRGEYIKYHLEVYYGNILGVFDRCLLLVNHLYDLGFQPRDAKYNSITQNEHLKNTKTLDVLKTFHKALENIRSVRNYIEHQGSLSDKDLDQIALYELLTTAKSIKIKQIKLLRLYLKLQYRSYIRKKKKEIKVNNSGILTLTNSLFNSLEKPYLKGMANFD